MVAIVSLACPILISLLINLINFVILNYFLDPSPIHYHNLIILLVLAKILSLKKAK